MSLFAVKNADGWFWDFTDEGFYEENDTRTAAIPNRDYANQIAKEHDGTLTEYVQKPVPVVVSEAEAKILEGAKKDKHPCMYIAWKVQVDDEDRLLRAYVNGWTVEKPKRFIMPMEGTKLADGTIAYATLDHTGVWTIKAYSKKQSTVAFHNTVTQAEIDAAPDWVKAIKPVEVTEDEQ
jgi:hypothetical protein